MVAKREFVYVLGKKKPMVWVSYNVMEFTARHNLMWITFENADDHWRKQTVNLPGTLN